jgi:hypothetical protein
MKKTTTKGRNMATNSKGCAKPQSRRVRRQTPQRAGTQKKRDRAVDAGPAEKEGPK